MKENIIALVDCDSFFVSCEQAVDESLKGKPVCVISGTRGCVLARSKEAKELGIKMGLPYFMAKKEFPGAIYIDTDMQRYKDFSRRIMAILKDFSPTVEVYSIDEAFIELSGLKKMYKCDYYQIAKRIRERIATETGIGVSIGVSKSKVLAKLASEKAKPGVGSGIYLIGNRKIERILRNIRVEEIWGIGKQTALLFSRWGVLSCTDLVKKSDEWLKLKVGKRGVELKHELLGECIDKVKTNRKPPKSIQDTRSFADFTSDIDYIKNALNIHIHNSCKRLRYFGGKCKTVGVMLRSKDFAVYYEKENLENFSNFELEISRVAMKLLGSLYDSNTLYRSCGVTLDGIDYSEDSQLSLFSENNKKDFSKLAQSIDKLEARFGKNIVKTGFVEK